MQLVMKLVRPASKSGGDRYECDLPGEDRPLVIYWPQSVSRTGGIPYPYISVNISVDNQGELAEGVDK